MSIHPHIRAFVTSSAFIISLNGCGPTRLLPSPPTMPDEIGGRVLWNTPAACIYARDKAVAGETETLVRELSDELKSAYQRDLGRGIVIVTDVGDPTPIVETMAEAKRLDQQSTIKGGKRKSGNETKDNLPEQERKKMEELGFTEATICRLAVARLDEGFRNRLGLEAAICPDIGWVVCCPSRPQIRETIRTMINAATEQTCGDLGKLWIAPWMPLLLNESVKKMNAGIKLVMTEGWVENQADWDSDLRRAAIEEMAKRLGVYDEIDFGELTTKPADPRPGSAAAATSQGGGR